jgi:hypothetical protein
MAGGMVRAHRAEGKGGYALIPRIMYYQVAYSPTL